jgi:hypothetical protein
MRSSPTVAFTHLFHRQASTPLALGLVLLAVGCRDAGTTVEPGPTETGSTEDAGRVDAALGSNPGADATAAHPAPTPSVYARAEAGAGREAGITPPGMHASHGDATAVDARARNVDADAVPEIPDAAACELDACNYAGTCIRRDSWTECSCEPALLSPCDFPRFRAIGPSRTDRERTMYLLSGDGRVVAGTHSFDTASPTSIGVTWTLANGLRSLEQDPAGPTVPTGINVDGSLINGLVEVGRDGKIAVVWHDGVLQRVSPDSGVQFVEDRDGKVPLDGSAATRFFEVFDSTPDGRVMVGRTRHSNDNSRTEAAFWTSENGVTFLSEHLNAHGVDVSDWDLWHVNAVSDDGNTMIGLGVGPDVGYRWYLQLAAPEL